MPRNAGVSVENAFTKGLITEVTGVNSPENSVTDSVNIVYDRRGRAFPRKGFEYEEGAVQNNISQSGVRNEFVWETVSENNSKNFVVVQLGSRLRFFEVTGEGALSGNLMSFSVNLLTYKISTFTDAQVRNALCSFTSGNGYLFVAHPYCDTIYIRYNESSNSTTTSRITIKIRDFEGVEDNLDVDERPSSLSNAHKYNLYNQGWYSESLVSGGSEQNTVDYWASTRTDYPANSDVWWYYTRTSGTDALEVFDTELVPARTGFFGNTPAAKGHYIVNALQTNRTSLSGVTATESSSGGLRPSVVAFFSGRAFYSGVGKSGFSSTIYFTQIIEDDSQLGKCYQANDPTSKDTFDLLPSDGGTIKIQDVSAILDMKTIGQSLYVFATNGVWAITGSDNSSFKATDYTVAKISAFPAVSRTSIVDVGGLPLWWNYEGIYSLQKTQVGLTTEVTNLTQQTIQQFYDAIPQDAKASAKGAFNEQTGLVYWIYNILPDEGDYKYTNILVLDVVTGAFYPMTIPDTSTQISGVISVRSAGATFVEEVVTNNALANVTDNALVNVTALVQDGFSARTKTFKFLTVTGSDISFAELTDDSYLDWGTTEYTYYFVTGYRIRGELLKKFQTNYLTVITEEVDEGSAFVQGIWDYAYDADSGRYTTPQQVYRQRLHRNYQRAKVKMRGSGYSLQFKFSGESGKPFVIVGWAGFETSNAIP